MTRLLWRMGLQRGILGGSRFFTIIGVTAGAIRVLKHLAGNEPKTLYKRKLAEGEVLIIKGDSPRR